MSYDIRKEFRGGGFPEEESVTIFSSDLWPVMSEAPDEPIMLVFACGIPDFVVLPAELGGSKAYIERMDTLPGCPMCGGNGKLRAIVLRPPHLLVVVCCPLCGQYGYVTRESFDRVKQAQEEEETP